MRSDSLSQLKSYASKSCCLCIPVCVSSVGWLGLAVNKSYTPLQKYVWFDFWFGPKNPFNLFSRQSAEKQTHQNFCSVFRSFCPSTFDLFITLHFFGWYFIFFAVSLAVETHSSAIFFCIGEFFMFHEELMVIWPLATKSFKIMVFYRCEWKK